MSCLSCFGGGPLTLRDEKSYTAAGQPWCCQFPESFSGTSSLRNVHVGWRHYTDVDDAIPERPLADIEIDFVVDRDVLQLAEEPVAVRGDSDVAGVRQLAVPSICAARRFEIDLAVPE